MRKQLLYFVGAVAVSVAPLAARAQTTDSTTAAPVAQAPVPPAQPTPVAQAQPPQPAVLGAQSQGNQGPPLTKATRDVLQMTAAGVQEGVLTAFVQTSPHTFNLTADAIIYLQGRGIPSALITDMMTRDTELHNEGMIAARTLQEQNANWQVPQPNPYAQPVPQQPMTAYQAATPMPYDYGYDATPYDYGYNSYPYYPYAAPYYYPGWYGGGIVIGRFGYGGRFGGHPGVGFHGGVGVGGGIHGGVGGGFHGGGIGGGHVSGGGHH